MSSAILRRNSSKEGLQNLLRITAQRSIEDAEEIERERRRRAREAFRSTSSQSDSPRDGGTAAEDSPVESELKPSSQQALEEDEGFSDWTQKLERRRQRRLEEQGPAEDEEEEEEQRRRRRQQQQQRGPSRDEMTRPQAPGCRPGGGGGGGGRVGEPQEEQEAKEKRKEVKVSYTSKVFLSQEVKHFNGNGDAAGEEVTSHLLKTIRPLRSASQGGAQDPEEDAEVFLETEQKLEKIRRSHQEKESQELELLRQKQAESEAELEELKKRREERRKIREEEERRREEEEYQRQLKEEEERRHMKEEIERRRMEATERRMKNLSTSSIGG
ncbi:hypothetical protein ANANG_G00201480 [Anguilla anguilla]|uniref:Uncharacterized protein n=1 Tax=Anguilla anguilla TaxID=7936 RepID=A0A9D3RQF8_ANGAN|nr:hypothetical protein ANANG_G00201480 [Anguilla anguilla]